MIGVAGNSRRTKEAFHDTSPELQSWMRSLGNTFIFEYRRRATGDESLVETFEYTANDIFWDELEIFPDTDPRVELGEVDSGGEQHVRIHLPVPQGARVIGAPKVSAR